MAYADYRGWVNSDDGDRSGTIREITLEVAHMECAILQHPSQQFCLFWDCDIYEPLVVDPF